ncbi:hypothetical protein [Neobacillus mesonae]|uniref:hypothetical protein n=1 Tax=Neobacillus mesonae TaxID=1193713 RepID=UPI0020418187|nr:hypothetical protein [Neobacillus mesonae]MCM3570560.1 hypothetical protein [Neobacillus mesonae]
MKEMNNVYWVLGKTYRNHVACAFFYLGCFRKLCCYAKKSGGLFYLGISGLCEKAGLQDSPLGSKK